MSTEQELISVIVPVYNVEAYLPRCLETIAAQTYRNLEIILVDDGSTDESGEICDAFAQKDSRAKVIHQSNQGLWAARNVGKRAAHGEYLTFPDGDDYMHIDTIKLMYEAINSNGGFDFAMVERKPTERLDENIKANDANNLKELTQNELIDNMFSKNIAMVYWSQWGKLYRAALIKDVWSDNYRYAQDWDFNFRVFLRVKRAVLIRRPMYFYVQRPTAVTKHSDYRVVVLGIKCQMFIKNHAALPKEEKHYDHYLLDNLYTRMVFYKNRYYGTDKQPEVFRQCREYIKATRKAYWTCRLIPFYKRIGVTLLLHCPRLTRWLMKKTKNY